MTGLALARVRRIAPTSGMVAIIALAVSGVAAEPLPCQGRYNVVSGDVTMSSGGLVHVDPRNRNEGIRAASVSVSDQKRVE